jgi:hypothetical protein
MKAISLACGDGCDVKGFGSRRMHGSHSSCSLITSCSTLRAKKEKQTVPMPTVEGQETTSCKD